jgi:nitroreductase
MKKNITTKKIIEFKKTRNKFPIINELKERFSPRFFSSELIKETFIKRMIEAARWAPSAYNFQPWSFHYAHKGSTAFDKIFSCLPDKNSWAETASVYIVACYIKDREAIPNNYAKYDLGLAVMSMIIQAQSMGIYSRQMGIFDKEKIQKLLKIDKSEAPFIVLAIGKIGDYRNIGDELLIKEFNKRERKISISKIYGNN